MKNKYSTTSTSSIISVFSILFYICGCNTTVETGVDNYPSPSRTKYMDVRENSEINTVGIESSDIQAACRSMVGKMLANPLLSDQQREPHLIIDASYFKSYTASRINKHMLIDLFRTELLNAAEGRLIIVGREYADMVENERELGREGFVGDGKNPKASVQLGGDYRLGGRITDQTVSDSGKVERYTQITFEMIDLQSGQIVFGDTYSFKKRKNISVLYR